MTTRRLNGRREMDILKKEWGHKNLTLSNLIAFGIASGLGALLCLGLIVLFTEAFGIWYAWSSLIAGAITIVFKFILTSIIGYGGLRACKYKKAG